MVIVRTRFVTTHNNVRFAHKKAQIISFMEHGFEKLGLGHQTVVSRGVHTELNRVRFEEYRIKSCSLRGVFLLETDWEALVFGLFFPAPFWRINLHII